LFKDTHNDFDAVGVCSSLFKINKGYSIFYGENLSASNAWKWATALCVTSSSELEYKVVVNATAEII
jgi:hypothetical protein